MSIASVFVFLFYFLFDLRFTFGHSTLAYSHDSSIGGDKPDWMIELRDNTYLSELSLPGTHDSAAFYGGDSPQTQSISLADQLNAGIRVFDIRCRHINNGLDIYHGIIYQNQNLDNVFDAFKTFLNAHVGETILARIILDEHTPSGNSRSEEETFEEYYQRHSSWIWSNFDTNNYPLTPPLLGDVRSKIVILQNFVTTNKKYGLEYGGVLFDIQDNFELTTNWDLYYTKWEPIKSKVDDARTEITEKTKFHINYLSGSGGSFPYFVASGHSSHGTGASRLSTGLTTLTSGDSYPDFPRTTCLFNWCTISFEGTNILFENHFANQLLDYVGIIMIDFPGKALIDKILAKNLIYYNCNWESYLNRNSDLQNAYGTDLNAARNHFYTNGQNEGRICQSDNTNIACNWSCYLERYTDLRNVYGFDLNGAKSHYYAYGSGESRTCQCDTECNWMCYLNRYTDLQNAFGSDNFGAARSHWYGYGVFEGRNCLC